MSWLREELKKLVIEALTKFKLHEDRLGVPGWSHEHAQFLKFCLENDVISEKDLENTVGMRIRQLGRESYDGHIRAGMPPDHTISPQALACAIRMKGGLGHEEVGRIRFDHGETPFTFQKGIEDTFIADIIGQLRSA